MTRVLVVEDDASIREIIGLALGSAGHEPMLAPDGAEALERLGREDADLILLDVRMPGMDGAEFARRYRAATSRPAPIVVLTAARDATLSRGDLAASRYLEKPFDLDELLAVIDEVAGADAAD